MHNFCGRFLIYRNIFISYRTLAQFLQKQMSQNKTLPEKDVVTMFSQMVDALKYLHDHNILHRSLTESSICI